MKLFDNLKFYLNARTEDLEKYFKVNELGWAFQDNGADVLAVVHLDTVLDFRKKTKHVPVFETLPSGDVVITSINLDDRLGLWMLLDYLPSLEKGIKYDILFTTDEEIGRSTAQYFKTNKKYKWMFQFDRKGYGTVVMYDYETKELCNRLETLYNYDVQDGTFSDICNLTDLGCAGFNFGCGYVNEHSTFCSSRLSWVNTALMMFIDFYYGECNTHFPYEDYYKFPARGGMYEDETVLGDWMDDVIDDDTVWNTKEKKFTKTPASRKFDMTMYCAECGRVLLESEEEVCEMCLNKWGLARCRGCGVEFDITDITDDGYCYSCR